MLISKSRTFAVDPKNLTTHGLEHPTARSGQLRVARDVQHGLAEVSHLVWMSSERLAFVWPWIFGFSGGGYASFASYSETKWHRQKCSPPELIQAFERRR